MQGLGALDTALTCLLVKNRNTPVGKDCIGLIEEIMNVCLAAPVSRRLFCTYGLKKTSPYPQCIQNGILAGGSVSHGSCIMLLTPAPGLVSRVWYLFLQFAHIGKYIQQVRLQMPKWRLARQKPFRITIHSFVLALTGNLAWQAKFGLAPIFS